MERFRLTAEEMMIIELLFLASIDEGHPEYLLKYIQMPTDKNDFREILLSLQNKGVILKSYKIPVKGQSFDPEAVEFNSIFLKAYRKFSNELGAEFMRTYPSIGIIGGSEVPLKNFAKKFHSEEEFLFAYGKMVGWNSDKHQEVISIIKWGIENNCRLLNMNIADFVVSHMWDSIKELREGNGTMNFDSMEVI